jgi:3-phenylpropionate/cinnamic acid dioxygenase small subunit
MGSLHESWRLTAPGAGNMTTTELRVVDDSTYLSIQRFLFREAALLDGRDYRGWLALATEDIRYRVYAMVARDAGAKAVDYAIVDEDLVGLKSRIDQISDPKLTRAENPPSMTRRVVSNIEAYAGEMTEHFLAKSYLLAFRSRPSSPAGGFYVAERRDVLRRSEGGWRLAKRDVHLDHVMLFDGALSTLL